ncbi:hypothetical protein [Nocardia brasiliensis]|uniref:hypothetical protein n=1 Tax=Nocardia brasiliensis TaxID=37326 RepID=UPI0024540C57|nr:hypothetical protein [Nocardia brasiliensis]
MTGPWFASYEADAARGALMRVHTRGCSCFHCRYEFRPAVAESSSGTDPRISTPGAGDAAPAPGVAPSHDEDQADEFDGEAWDLAHDRDIDARNGVW